MSESHHAVPLAERWERYWFHPISPHIYAVLRLVFGVLCLLDLLGTTPISRFWDLDGITPVPGGGNWGFRAWVAQSGYAPLAARAFFFGTFLAYSCMAAGIGGNAAVVASFLASIWQGAWNVLPLSAAHQVLTAVLFSLLWADCTQLFALGRARAPGEVPRAEPVGPLRLLQYQVSLIYFSSGVAKFTSELWRDGTALYYVLSNNVLPRFPIDVVPPALYGVATLATYGTLVFELGFPFLVAWRRTRPFTLLAGVALHLGAWVMLEVGPFSWVMIATYVAFIPPDRVAALAEATRLAIRRAISR